MQKILALCLFLTACEPKTKTVNLPSKENELIIPIFTVKVNGSDNLDTIPITILYQLPTEASERTDTIKLNKNGEGSFENVLGPWAMDYTLSVGQIFYGHAFLEKGLHLNIDFDAIKVPEEEINSYMPDGISFSGDDAEKTNLLNAFWAFEHPLKDSAIAVFKTIRSQADTTTEQRIASTERFKELLRTLIADTFVQQHPTEHVDWLLNKYYTTKAFWFCLNLGSDENWYKHFTKNQVPSFGGFGNNEWYFYKYNWYGVTSQLRPQIENQLIELIDATTAVRNDSVFIALQKVKDRDKQAWDRIYRQAKLDHKSQFLSLEISAFKEAMLAFEQPHKDFMLITGGPSDAYDRFLYLKEVIKEVKDPFLSEMVKENYNELKQKAERIESALAKTIQMPAKQTSLGVLDAQFNFGAHMYQATHTDFESLLKAIQDSFKGMALIFDVWATWCGPCKQDMKASVEVKKQLTELPVEVVYLCTSRASNPTVWKEIVLEYETSGTHIWLGEDLTKKLIDYYGLKYYPSYYYYSANGELDKDYVHHIAEIDVEDLSEKLKAL